MGKSKHAAVEEAAQHQRVLELIAESDDIGDVALKGHLYVEYWLNEILVAKWGTGGSALIQRFGFEQKLTIAKETGLLPARDVYLVPLLTSLNSCRNAYAHSLFSIDLVKIVEAFPPRPDLDEFSKGHFDSVEAWALVYLKVWVSIACIELIWLTCTISNRWNANKYADALRSNALNRLRPPQHK